jgi:hypothetical protein
MAQMGFFDLSDRYASLDAKKDPFLEIDRIVPWGDFRPVLKKVWRKQDGWMGSNRLGVKSDRPIRQRFHRSVPNIGEK